MHSRIGPACAAHEHGLTHHLPHRAFQHGLHGPERDAARLARHEPRLEPVRADR
ncbi:MAG: hypothetical protein IPJ41_00425 [Phycisphaerales bacterium]|nr:hypothetical protein [Phycisphaerales bacterium]